MTARFRCLSVREEAYPSGKFHFATFEASGPGVAISGGPEHRTFEIATGKKKVFESGKEYQADIVKAEE